MTGQPGNCRSLVELLHWRAVNEGDRVAFTFLADGEREEVITYAELDARARVIAGMLQEMGLAGERALLLYPPGEAYVCAFVGCLYAGTVAVPAYPPRVNRPDPRIEAIAGVIDAAVVLTVESVAQTASQVRAATPAMSTIPWRTTNDLGAELGQAWRPTGYDEDGLAFVQFTSGSTATPRGVMVTHRNLSHNLEAIRLRFEHTPESQGVIWLPPYHDMGLIGGILQPLYAGFPVTLMPPSAFIQRPVRWLRAVSRFRATTSGGPDFAFDLCARKVTPEERETLDLSSWRIAFCGAEPVRAATLDRFVELFQPCGFRRTAFYPCYGLAESTLMVTGGAAAAAPVVSDHESSGTALVGCGQAIPDTRVRIVDPYELHARGDREVGEIWVAGPSVAAGYWQRPDDTAAIFGAHLADTGDGPYLRTGDLGFLDGGELFVTARIKDVIVIRGRNYYPSDLEAAAEESHRSLRPHACAAFGLDDGDEPHVVVVAELARIRRDHDNDEVIRAIRRTIADRYAVLANTVVLVRPGGIARTSSGKIQRQVCRTAYLGGMLDVVASDTMASVLPPLSDDAIDRETLLRAPAEQRHALLTMFLRQQWARALGVPAAELDPDQSLGSLGLDSLLAVDLKHLIEVRLGVVLPMARFVEQLTVADLAAGLLDDVTRPAEPAMLTPTEPEPEASAVGRPATMDLGEVLSQGLWRRQDAVAVVDGDDVLTFDELARRAALVTQWLRARNGGAGVVGIATDRPADLVVGAVGILLAGSGFEIAPACDLAADDAGLQLAESGPAPLPGMRLIPRAAVASVRPVACVIADRRGEARAIAQHDVVAYFARLDTAVGCDPSDVLRCIGEPDALSVLEMLWALSRGAAVTFGAAATRPRSGNATPVSTLPFSLFYFSSDEEHSADDRYRLLLDGASFADRHDFEAVWIPERHGHRFGGLYPNPSVLAAALAVTTSRVRIRAGSVVLPLHDPVRVVEEWSVVDNLSHGRVDLAFARGWNANDFIFAPQNFANSAEVLFSSIETVQRLWRGESVLRRNGVGVETEYRVFPRPRQPELPLWVTCTSGAERFVEAGRIGANVLTALLFQSVDELGDKVRLYREARAEHGHDPAEGRVTVMLHTFVGERLETVRELVRQPFIDYLASSVDLWRHGSRRLDELGETERRDVLDYAFERYFGKAALLGTPRTCAAMVEALQSVGVDEIACLIDFGVDPDVVLAGLDTLDELRRLTSPGHLSRPTGDSAVGTATPTIVQCTAEDAARLDELQRPDGGQPRRILLRGTGSGQDVIGAYADRVRVIADQDRRAWLMPGPASAADETTVPDTTASDPTAVPDLTGAPDLTDLKARLDLLVLAGADTPAGEPNSVTAP